MTDKHTLLERLEYTAEHGIFCASTAGMLASYSEAATRITALEAEKAELVEALNDAIAGIEGPDLYEAICCSGHECGCRGSSSADLLVHDLRATLAKARQSEGGE